jgi:hypothetical protein
MTTTKNIPAQAETPEQVTPQQIVNEAIGLVVEATGIDVQKSRYKAMRAIAWQAFVEAIEAGDFDALVRRAITNVVSLPSGWGIEVAAKPEPVAVPVKKATASKTATR